MQKKKIEENNRMVKTRDLIKIIRDTKGRFHAKMGSIKDRNGMGLTETEDIKKRWRNRRGGLVAISGNSSISKRRGLRCGNGS